MMLKLATVKVRLIIAAVAILLVVIIVVVMCVAFIVVGSTTARAADCTPPVNPGVAAPGESRDEQVSNAQIIDQTAAKLGLSGAASRIAIITAIGESSLLNIAHDDDAMNPDGTIADGGGLFQQQPSQGWGTFEQVMDPEYATTSFLTGPGHDRTGGLVAVAGWESMEATLAIHEVQGNADANHYARYYTQADEIIAAAGIDVTRPGNDAPSDPGTGGGGEGCGPVAPIGQAASPLTQPYNQTDDFGPRDTGIAGASTWHAAVDLQNWPNPCGQPVYATHPGTVTLSDRLWLSIESPEGYVISYLHMYKWERSVDVGATVAAGQQIGVVGNEGPSGGCHLDIRINVDASTNAAVSALPRGDAGEGYSSYVNPVDFYRLFSYEICPPEWCSNQSDL